MSSIYRLTMVPYLRVPVEVGANAMTDEVGTHTEAIGVCYITRGVEGAYIKTMG